MSCPHPPERYFCGSIMDPDTGEVTPDADERMWIGCCQCGEIVREAPLFTQLMAEFEAQQAQVVTQPSLFGGAP